MTLRPSQASTAPLSRALLASQANEVLIDGVSFVRDPRGKKLVRKADHSIHPDQSLGSCFIPAPSIAPNNGKSTPVKALIGGATYVRTKSGNLIALSALKKFQSQRIQSAKTARLLALVDSMKSKYSGPANYQTWDPARVRGPKTSQLMRPPLKKKNEQCRFFAKTGTCRKGLTCVYQHEPSQVAICPRFLRHKCAHSANSCPLSHKPNPHNMEYCSHFPRCTKADCPYPHVKPSSSHICKEFADLGWCSKGIECGERHVRECPEFSSKGTCSNPGCRLPHVINRNQNELNDDQEQPPGQSDEDGGTLFFTDVKGKRKADGESLPEAPDHPPCHVPRGFKGISHHSGSAPPPKRLKQDDMAGNDDFVMFETSEKEDGPDEEDEMDDGEASSVDSEELHSVLLDEYPGSGGIEQARQPTLSPTFSFEAGQQPAKLSKRSSLERGEEIEEGEIFDDDDDEACEEMETTYGDTSEGEDEDIERQLLGDRQFATLA